MKRETERVDLSAAAAEDPGPVKERIIVVGRDDMTRRTARSKAKL